MKFLKILCVILVLINLAGCNRDSGDRVIVNKFDYDFQDPERFQVVVFKWPGNPHNPATGPVEDGVPKNYIKRLLGLPGEIIAIFFGQLFHFPPQPGVPGPFEDEDMKVDPLERWKHQHTHATSFSLTGAPGDNDTAVKMKTLYETPGKFDIIRKPPEVVMAMRRIVNDNDFQAKDLGGVHRWDPKPDSAWKASKDYRTFEFNGGDKNKADLLNYQHLVVQRGAPSDRLPPLENKPQLITDFTDYNAFFMKGQFDDNAFPPRLPPENWVGDLMLECTVNVKKAQGEFLMELNRGADRFQVRWNLSDGMCSLWRKSNDEGEWLPLSKDARPKPTAMKAPGEYELRFANFDSRLMVWVNRTMPFDLKEGDYPAPELPRPGETIDDVVKRIGATEADLQPASIGAKDTQVEVSHIRVWRDTFYTGEVGNIDAQGPEYFSDPKAWSNMKNLHVRTMYVQPGHYLCLGDNSTASSDSRDWGLVADRLLLGRALAVYWPPTRLGPIH